MLMPSQQIIRLSPQQVFEAYGDHLRKANNAEKIN